MNLLTVRQSFAIWLFIMVGWGGADQVAAIQKRYVDQDHQGAQKTPGLTRNFSQPTAGLKVILHETDQLEVSTQAKAAFQRAAANWEAVIQTPVTIVIDADFGPGWFGQPFPQGALGYTTVQMVTLPSGYSDARAKLIESASDDQEKMLYAGLPLGSIPTDLGATDTVISPSANLRALGLLPATADPDQEMDELGPPPAIGFNSDASFDFDATDGIDADKIDFEALATREIGHVLGFVSNVGQHEINSSVPIGCSVLDLFRFRPGITEAGFPTAQRILSAGGEQIFFSGQSEFPFSTGRPDGSGGDGAPASFWESAELAEKRIGIMSPSLSKGERIAISANDLAALDRIGYQIKASEPDFSISLSPAQITLSPGQKGQLTVNVTRTGGFSGRVTITAPDTKALKITLKPHSQTTSENTALISYKVKPSAPQGMNRIVFTAQDDAGHVRTASLTVILQN